MAKFLFANLNKSIRLDERPIMVYQHGRDGDEDSYTEGPRIRIFYPDGRVQWISIRDLHEYYESYEKPHMRQFYTDKGWKKSCFIRPGLQVSIQVSLEIAEMYDETQGFERMEFLGYL